jgi:hypothetical protein
LYAAPPSVAWIAQPLARPIFTWTVVVFVGTCPLVPPQFLIHEFSGLGFLLVFLL